LVDYVQIIGPRNSDPLSITIRRTWQMTVVRLAALRKTLLA